MKQRLPESKIVRYAAMAVAGILVLMPFHAVFTTWLGATFGHIDLFRIWKEILLVPLAIISLIVVYKDSHLKKWFIHSPLVALILIYTLLHLVLGLVAYKLNRVNASTLIYALLINLRFLVLFLICFVVASKAPWLKKNWRGLLLWPALIVISFGLLQQFVLPANVLSHVGYGPKTIPAYHTVDQKPDYLRLQSTLRGPNPLGAYLVLVLSAISLLFIQLDLRKARSSPDRINSATNSFSSLDVSTNTSPSDKTVLARANSPPERTILRKSSREKFGRKYWAFIIAVTGIVLLFTYSRSAWLGAILSVGLVVYWALRNQKLRRWMVTGGVVCVVVLGGVVVALRNNNVLQNTLFHTDETSRSSKSSNAVRTQALSEGAKSVWHEPLGRGPGTAGPASFRNNHTARIAENYYLQIAQEVGIVGLVLFAAINVLIFKELWQKRNDQLAVILLASFVGLTLVNMISHAWADDSLSIIFWGFLGIALAPDILEQKAKAPRNV